MKKQNILLLCYKLDSQQKQFLARCLKDLDKWLATLTDKISWDWTLVDTAIPIRLIKTHEGGVNARFRSSLIDPVIITDEGRKVEASQNKDFNIVALIYNNTSIKPPAEYPLYPMHSAIEVSGFTVIQKSIPQVDDKKLFNEFLSHEIFHAWYFLVKNSGVNISDRVHQLSGLYDPRDFANFSSIVTELVPYYDVLTTVDREQKKEDEMPKPTVRETVKAALIKNRPKYLVIHHTLTARDKTTFEAVNKYHKSLGWGKIGYHYFIDGKGRLYQGRKDWERGAHTKQGNINGESLGICLSGNFDKEMPSDEQIETLQMLLLRKMAEHSIPKTNILPHRHWATYKSCYGNNLPDDWASKLVNYLNNYMELIKINNDIYAIGADNRKHLILNWESFQKGYQMGLWGTADTAKTDREKAKLPDGNIIILVDNN